MVEHIPRMHKVVGSMFYPEEKNEKVKSLLGKLKKRKSLKHM
jgi:hypothetical protein